LALVFILFDLISLAGGNGGGHIAHIGGAMFGYIYVSRSTNNKTSSYDWFSKLFNKKTKPLKTVYKSSKQSKNSGTKDNDQVKIDAILDKISKSGYDTLTQKEKEFLFKQGK